MENIRIDRVTQFLWICKIIAKRSRCQRGQVGCVIVNDRNRILATGYNGPPKDTADCIESITCDLNVSCKRSIHAEINAIASAAYEGVPLKDGILYCTTAPCLACAQAIAASGIKMVVFLEEYKDDLGTKFLELSLVKVQRIIWDLKL